MTPAQYRAIVLDEKLFAKLDEIEKAKYALIDAEVDNLFEAKTAIGQMPTSAQLEDLQQRITSEVELKFEKPAMTTEFKDFEDKTGTPGLYGLTSKYTLFNPANTAPAYNVEQSPTKERIEPGMGTAMMRQQVIAEPRATESLRSILENNKLVGIYTDQGMDKDTAETLSKGLSGIWFDEMAKDPNQNQEELFKRIEADVLDISNAPIITEEEYRRRGPADPLYQALSKQITQGSLPDYSPLQLQFLAKTQPGIKKKVQEEYFENQKIGAINYVNVNTSEGRVKIPQETAQYIMSTHADLTDVVYTKEVDKLIRDASGTSGVMQVMDRQYKKTRDMQALADIRARLDTGADAWHNNATKKALVIANPEKYSDYGIFSDTSIIGGTKETTGAYMLRAALVIPNTAMGIAYPVAEYTVGTIMGAGAELLEGMGLITDLYSTGETYFDPGEMTRSRAEQRAKVAPMYADDPIAANVALNLGATGEAAMQVEALNLKGWSKGITLAGGFMTDIADPSFAIAVAGAKLIPNAVKINSAQKALYGVGSKSGAFKMAGKLAVGEVLDDFNGISALNKLTGGKMNKVALSGDIRLHMADDLVKNISARAVIKEAVDNKGTNIDVIKALGRQDLLQTQYWKQVSDAAEGGDFLAIRNAMNEVDEINYQSVSTNAKNY